MKKSLSSPRIIAILQAVFVTVLWSSSWVLIKFTLRDELPALTFAGMRYTLAWVVLGFFMIGNPSHRKEIGKLNTRDWWNLALLGIVFYSLTQGAMFMTLKYLPANMLSLLLNLTAVFVGMAGIFLLREKPTLLQWMGIWLAMIGVLVYFLPIHLPQGQVLGIGIGLFCMLMNVLSSLFSRATNRTGKYSPLLVTFIPMGIGSILLLATGLSLQGIGTLSSRDWLVIGWLAIVNTALTFWLWNRSLRILTAVESAIINSLMLPQIAILAFIFFGEEMSGKEVIGMLIVGLGTAIVQLKSRKTM